MKKVTVWKRGHKDNEDIRFAHNHIEDGWADTINPHKIKPEYKHQDVVWSIGNWERIHTYLDGNYVIR